MKKDHGEDHKLHKGKPVVLIPFTDQVWFKLGESLIVVRRLNQTDNTIIMDTLPDDWVEKL